MAWIKVKKFFNLIDFQHTVFGLPFAYLGAFLALPGFPGWETLFWITLAMVGARTAALCMNRAIDLPMDRLNPRTSNWALPRGEFSLYTVWAVAFLGLIVLLISAFMLNPLCFKLSPLAILILWGYSYTKRFTWWCHLILGLAIGIGPVGGWLAVTGKFSWVPVLLTLAVAFWIAGFDIIYACQDIDFDRRSGLFSIPARFGARGAFYFARVFHLLCVVFLVLSGWANHLGVLYYLGVAVTAAILWYEHSLVKPDNLRLVNIAAFKVNRYVSLVVFTLSVIDVLVFSR